MKRISSLRGGLAALALLSLFAPAASAQCTDDFLEENDTCATPTQVFGGFNASLKSLYTDDDFFRIHVPDGDDLTIDLTFTHALGDLDLTLLNPTCTNALAISTSVTDDEQVQYHNGTGAGLDLIARVTMYAPNPDILCNDYDISFALSTTIACQDDNEFGNLDNDTCADANLVFPDVAYLNFGVLSTDSDYYKITVPAGNTLQVDLTFTHALGDIDLVLYDANCSTVLATAVSVTDDEVLAWTNTGATDVEVRWHVYVLDSPCNLYNMFASLADGSCGPDDVFEENDTCAQATPLGAGTYPGLQVGGSDPDFYRFQVPQGQALVLDVQFLHSLGDIDLRLYDACGGSLIGAAGSVSDDESLSWSNHVTPLADVYLEVYVLGAGSCNTYDLTAGLSGVPPGTNYCVALANSTGSPALMSATGTRSVAANDVVLRAEPLPANKSGLFFYGPNQIQVPFGNGNRCVGGMLFRRPTTASDAAGVLAQPLDLTALAPAGAILPGSSWNFQAWFRDPAAGGALFNLSDGYHVAFIP